jgi:soluble epoxide hydrolase/lipid-phosphate phosphatase
VSKIVSNGDVQGDYRLLVPDLRGFGPSIHASFEERLPTMTDLVGDLVCILENAQVDSAICVGYKSRFVSYNKTDR